MLGERIINLNMFPSVYNPLMEDLPESMKVDLLMEKKILITC